MFVTVSILVYSNKIIHNTRLKWRKEHFEDVQITKTNSACRIEQNCIHVKIFNIFQHKIVNIFLPIIFDISTTSIWLRNKKIVFSVMHS